MRSYEVQGDRLIESDTCAARRALEACTATKRPTVIYPVRLPLESVRVEVTIAP